MTQHDGAHTFIFFSNLLQFVEVESICSSAVKTVIDADCAPVAVFLSSCNLLKAIKYKLKLFIDTETYISVES